MVNVRKDTKDVTVKVGGESVSIGVPVFVNTVKIHAGDEIVCLLAGKIEDDSDSDEPPAKRLKGDKASDPKGIIKGKGKGKTKPKK